MSILKICHYAIKDIAGGVCNFYYYDRELLGKPKSKIIQSNRDIKIESLLTGNKEILSKMENPNSYSEIPEMKIDIKSISIQGEFIQSVDLNKRILGIIDELPTIVLENDDAKIKRKIIENVHLLNINGLSKVSILAHPDNLDILSKLRYNLDIYYDKILKRDKIFIFSSVDENSIGLKIFRTESRYFIAPINIDDAIKVLEIKRSV